MKPFTENQCKTVFCLVAWDTVLEEMELYLDFTGSALWSQCLLVRLKDKRAAVAATALTTELLFSSIPLDRKQ